MESVIKLSNYCSVKILISSVRKRISIENLKKIVKFGLNT